MNQDTLTMKQDAGGYDVESRLKSGKDNPTPGTYENHYVTIQNLMAKRNDYPKYYVYKCSKQENQPQLWSPTVLRLGEMYLNRAEAYAKEPALGDALADLNVRSIHIRESWNRTHKGRNIRWTLVRVCEASSSEYTKHLRPSMRSTFVRVCEGPPDKKKI